MTRRALILSLVFLIPSHAWGGHPPNRQNSTPSYWKEMMAALPSEEMPELSFEERDAVNTEAGRIFSKAVAGFMEKKYQETAIHLKEMIDLFPKDETVQDAYFLIADSYSKMAEGKDVKLTKESVSLYFKAARMYPSSEEAPRALYQAGRGLFVQGFYYEALAQMERILVQYPKSRYVPKSMIAKGMISFYQKKYKNAESVLKKVEISDKAMKEDRELSRLWLVAVLHMEGRHDESEGVYRIVERSSPEEAKKNRLSLLAMGENLSVLVRYREGRDLLQQYLTLYPDSAAAPTVMLRMGDVHQAEGGTEEAMKLYSKVITSYSSTEAALIGKARLVEIETGSGKPVSATQVFNDLLSFKKDGTMEAALAVADAFKKAGMLEEAAGFYEAIINQGVSGRLKDRVSESLRGLIIEHCNRKEYPAALKMYQKGSSLLKRSRDPQLLRMIGDSYMEVGLPSGAVLIYEELLSSRYPHSSNTVPPAFWEDALFKGAEAYMNAGKKEEAEKTIKILLAEFPKTRFKEKLKQDGMSDDYMAKAKTSIEKEMFKEAADYFHKVIRLKEPSFLAAAYTGLGDAYFGMGEFSEAVGAYETGKAGGGEIGKWAAYRIGEAYLMMGDIEKAQESFRSVVREDKGIYGKVAAEELKAIGMKIKNPRMAD